MRPARAAWLAALVLLVLSGSNENPATDDSTSWFGGYESAVPIGLDRAPIDIICGVSKLMRVRSMMSGPYRPRGSTASTISPRL